ncbi:MAG: hypothetical protein F4227_10455 [Gammaproteobacteria bacterium]|nr:hypothetical protein [Gammaproteobacteria bacterium]MYF03359.1 hypothetical protein [Gammaproteobacteria bacterium]MYI76852.1 hypothetical protein [Gammaproteobacteria bacterium]
MNKWGKIITSISTITAFAVAMIMLGFTVHFSAIGHALLEIIANEENLEFSPHTIHTARQLADGTLLSEHFSHTARHLFGGF